MLKYTVGLFLVPLCLSYFVPLGIEFMGNKAHSAKPYDLSPKDLGECNPYVLAWNAWPGGVTGSIYVHRESDPSVDTWSATFVFDKVVTFKTYDGTVDKPEGKRFVVTALPYNAATQAGIPRLLNFYLTFDNAEEEPKLVALTVNGDKEVQCVKAQEVVPPEEGNTEAPDAGAEEETQGGAEVEAPFEDIKAKESQKLEVKTKSAEVGRGVYVPWPKKVFGIYILLADDDHKGFESNADWEPRLYEYQQQGANVLFFTFIHPQTMEIPPAFEKLAKTRGTDVEGAVPKDTVIIFAIGGYAYSVKQNPWNWLTSKEAAEAMAVRVAEWPKKYGIDGIDLDLEDGAGNRKEAGPNMVHFIRKLRELVPNMIISQPTYGYPQIDAENDVINESWDKEGKNNNIADSVGLMVYEGTQSLNYVKNFVNGAGQWEGFPIKVNVPNDAIILGAKGASSPDTFATLADEVLKNDYRGIMIWYASVKQGLQYAVSWDASEDKAAQDAYVEVVKKFKAQK